MQSPIRVSPRGVPFADHAFVPILLSVSDTCRALGIGRTYTYRLIAEGKLIARKIGGRTLVEAESIRRFAADLPVKGAVL